MFAIAFDMVIADLEKYYGQAYNNAYFEIGKELRKYGFYRLYERKIEYYVSKNISKFIS